MAARPVDRALRTVRAARRARCDRARRRHQRGHGDGDDRAARAGPSGDRGPPRHDLRGVRARLGDRLRGVRGARAAARDRPPAPRGAMAPDAGDVDRRGLPRLRRTGSRLPMRSASSRRSAACSSAARRSRRRAVAAPIARSCGHVGTRQSGGALRRSSSTRRRPRSRSSAGSGSKRSAASAGSRIPRDRPRAREFAESPDAYVTLPAGIPARPERALLALARADAPLHLDPAPSRRARRARGDAGEVRSLVAEHDHVEGTWWLSDETLWEGLRELGLKEPRSGEAELTAMALAEPSRPGPDDVSAGPVETARGVRAGGGDSRRGPRRPPPRRPRSSPRASGPNGRPGSS